MHAITILRQCLSPLLTHIHARRLATLFEAVASCIVGPRLTLTDVGRRFGGDASLRHKIKRADRLLGNTHLHREAGSIYTAMTQVAVAQVLKRAFRPTPRVRSMSCALASRLPCSFAPG